ncbi:MAG TPA: hypothetical protein ENN23_05130 [Deltaproteobacteria bacterium]|nr:hypothetical protein [Deltaproteobacteria bacterium]
MGRIFISYSLAKYRVAVDEAWKKMRDINLVRRLWEKDYTLWKPLPDEIANRLGWLEAPAQTLKKINYVRETLAPLAAGEISEVILLGMGGSSLAAEVFGQILGFAPGYPKLRVVDTTNPEIIFDVLQKIDWGKTVFIVSSKSGTTQEVTSLFHFFYNSALKNIGTDAGKNFIFITDEGSPLAETARQLNAFHVFLNNPDIGGRYSALSFPGIVPAALIGADAEQLLQRATIAAELERQLVTGASLGAALGALANKGRNKVTFILPQPWKSLGDWLEQLIAESTGKERKGIVPVLEEPVFDNFTYRNDRVFVCLQDEGAEDSARVKALRLAGHPLITVQLSDKYQLGAHMFLWEMATAVAAHFLEVNPFDQPDVETTKRHTRAMIAEHKKRKSMPPEMPAFNFAQGAIYGDVRGASPLDIFKNLLQQASPDDYICLQLYLSPSAQIKEAIASLRATILKKYKLPVTFGWGPRYLHSTGQLHKGDAGKSLFIQFTQDYAFNLDIPDEAGKEASSLTFGTLIAAQARGDRQALEEKGRTIVRYHLKSNAASLLNDLASQL